MLLLNEPVTVTVTVAVAVAVKVVVALRVTEIETVQQKVAPTAAAAVSVLCKD